MALMRMAHKPAPEEAPSWPLLDVALTEARAAAISVCKTCYLLLDADSSFVPAPDLHKRDSQDPLHHDQEPRV